MTEGSADMTVLRDILTQVGDMNRTVGGLLASVAHLSASANKMDEHARTISGEMGKIQTQLAVGSQRHAEFARSIADIDLRTEKIEAEMTKIPPIAVAVSDMTPKVKDLVEFKGRMAAIVLVAGLITGGAMTFIWEGVRFFTPDLHKIYERFH